MTFAVFQRAGKWAWDSERLTTWVRAGTSWSAATLRTYESMLSVPQVLLFFKFLIIFLITSGWTGLNVKEHLLFLIIFLSLSRGSVWHAGIPDLRVLTFFVKNSFMHFASSFGLLFNSPSTTNLVGGPPLFHPSQLLITLQVSLVLVQLSSLLACHCFFSTFNLLLILFLSCLKIFQSFSSPHSHA